jgi:hypothetical protein
MTRVAIGLLLALVVVGCGTDRYMKRLSDAEFDHFYALRVYMSEAERKEYLKLKTEEERNAWLQEKGLWDRFYKYDAEDRAAIVAGAVEVGWTKDKLLMAWGTPWDKQKLTGRNAQRSERYVYRLEVHEDGSMIVWEHDSKTEYKAVKLIQMDVVLDDDVITEIHEKGRWE